MQIKIRQAKPRDASNICTLLYQAHQYSEGMYPEPDDSMAMAWIVDTISAGYVLVAEKQGRIIGSVALTNYQFPWSPAWFLSLDWAYVSTKFRSGGTFDALVKAVNAFADERGAPIYAGVSSGKDAVLKDKLMQQKGYQYLGGQFMRLSYGQQEDQADDEIRAPRLHQSGG